MEYLFGLILTLFKVAIQASVYATLLLVLVRLFGRIDADHPLVRASRNGRRFWWRSGFVASLALWALANTCWGNHGLGDYARIPLGHGLVMEEINGTMAYFEPVMNENELEAEEILAYQVAGDVLCAKASDRQYFTYDLSIRRYQTFADSATYNATAQRMGLPLTTQFEPFYKHYARYWGGWRFWLLA